MGLAEFRAESCYQPRSKPTTPPVDDTDTHQLPQPLPRRRHRQLAVLHTLYAHERICDFSDFRSLPLNHQHFKTMIMVKMDMHTGHDVALKVVLDMSQFSG
jgi:hypothetical protein